MKDLNGDGKLDFAVADSGCALFSNPCTSVGSVPSATISVLLGFGDGTFVGPSPVAGSLGLSTIAVDLTKDGNLDLATSGGVPDSASVLLGNGDGTFQPEASYPVGHLPWSVAAGDFRNNGITDLVTANSNCQTPPCNTGSVSVLLGNGDGTFQPHVDYPARLEPVSVAVADFNGDGKLDLAVANYQSLTVSILLGNGDGTFQPAVDYPTAASPLQLVVGDFDQDGRPDLAVATSQAVSILLGNGDGTFKSHVDYPDGGGPIGLGDFNGDGKLDLAVAGSLPPLGAPALFVFFGNGDGTFQSPVTSPLQQGQAISGVADMNQDGKLDLITGDGILLGNGDGTFQPPIEYPLFFEQAMGDFSGDGAPDWVVNGSLTSNSFGIVLSVAFKGVSPASINFGSQGVGTTSLPRAVTISNPSNVSFNIASITASGSFSQTNNCGASLAPGAHCTVNVAFSPTATGLESGAVTITDSTKISPVAVPLNGAGVNGPFLTPFPGRVNFAPQNLNTKSNPAAVTLVNTGNASLNISGISIAGADSSDFAQNNTCGSSLVVGGNCNVKVTFTPAAGGFRTASLQVNDTAPGSPQTVALLGTVPDFSLAPGGQTTATVTSGQTANYTVNVVPGAGFNQTVSLTCSGAPAQSTCTVSPSSVTLNGKSVPATVSVSTTASTMGLTQSLNAPPISGTFSLWIALCGMLGLGVLAT